MVYLAVDIGASSGKLVKGRLTTDGRVVMETIHRFPNGPKKKEDGTLVWDLEGLYQGIVEGLKKAGKADYIAIDTWGVDFVLLDEDGNIIGDTVSYRDGRTDRLDTWPDQNMLYARTGIQFQRFNTIYQLLSLKQEHPEYLEKSAYMLFIPDYLAYRLTGVMKHEYTFASTTNLLDPEKRTWDYELIKNLDLPQHLFASLSDPGSEVGRLKDELRAEIGYDPMVILAPSHDSASAVVGAPVGENTIYLSSGTWSILGCVENHPYRSEEAKNANLSNEGGVDGTIRLLKNIMGTWMLQCLSKETGATFDELEKEAREADLPGLIDASDSRFLSPESMKDEISKALGKENLTRGEIASAVYNSLAIAYRDAIEEMEKITGRTFSHIAIVGGGSKDGYLNALTAMYTHRTVTAGPGEGTAIGNLLYQMITAGELTRDRKNEVLKASVRMDQFRRLG